MFNLGVGELLLVFLLALFILGPSKLPEVGMFIGKGIKEFKRSTQEIKNSLDLEKEKGDK